MGLSAAAEWLHAEKPLNKGVTTAQAIGAAGTFDLLGPGGTAVIQCEQSSTLVVEVDMTAGAAGDLTVVVSPYEADDATVQPIALPAVLTVGPTLSGGHDYYYGQFDITALDAVRVRITNNNVGAQTITRASWKIA